MKRALIVTPRMPWPLDDGGRIAAWQTVWSSSRAYETTLVSLVSEGEDSGPVPPALTELGVEVIRVPHRPPSTIPSAVSGLAGRWPYTLARYRNPRLAQRLSRFVREKRPAFALVNHLHLATYFDSLAPTPIVLRQHNVEHVWMTRFAEARRGTPTGWYASIQARRLRLAEARLCREAALVLSIQDLETKILRRLAPRARVETLPIGVDLTRFPEPVPESPPIVLLVGQFGWPTNVEGALRFLAEGWPLLRREHPDTRLRVFGKGISASLLDSARSAGAEVLGYVDSAAGQFATAAALVVPLWVGAGVRVKIIEALAAGLPVVSTSVGAEGLGLSDGIHYARGETPQELARRLSGLLASPERRAALSKAGRDQARHNWSLEAAAQLQNGYCEEVGLP
jgi:glycosyltransferase involved in cell wall biosynthesis